MYFMISLTALLAAIWVGLWFAGRFVAPIRRLISAAQQVTQRQPQGASCRSGAARAICAGCR